MPSEAQPSKPITSLQIPNSDPFEPALLSPKETRMQIVGDDLNMLDMMMSRHFARK